MFQVQVSEDNHLSAITNELCFRHVVASQMLQSQLPFLKGLHFMSQNIVVQFALYYKYH